MLDRIIDGLAHSQLEILDPLRRQADRLPHFVGTGADDTLKDRVGGDINEHTFHESLFRNDEKIEEERVRSETHRSRLN